jgi:predicted ester cyclase
MKLLHLTAYFILPPGLSNGPEGLKQLAGLFFEAFTDVHLQTADLIAEDYKVTARFTGKGNHTKGPFMAHKATGKEVQFVGADVFYIIDNKITEHWIYFEVLGLGEN